MNSKIAMFCHPAFGVLSALLLASAAHAQPNSVSVRGSLDGHGLGIVEGATLRGSASGSGNASQIGRFTYNLIATVDLATGAGSGVFVLVFLNGDVIYGQASGQGQPTSTPDLARITEVLTIRGGTGRFQGAGGSIAFDRLVDQTTLPAFESHSGTLTGTITTPGK